MDEQMIEVNEEQQIETAAENTGKIVFANDVVATIAAMAASDVEGIASMSGSAVSFLGKKNATKGVKITMVNETVTVDASVNVKYGFAIQNVCASLQKAMKNAIETMTGLTVASVNVNVVSVVFEKPAEPETEVREEAAEAIEE